MASDNGENYTLLLPEDLLLNIFFKSSVDSLIRAKCVCKHWYGLIKDPTFAYKHLHYQKEMKKPRLLFQYHEKETHIFKYAILDDITQSNSTYHNLCSLHVPTWLFMDGAVDGLYCLFNGRDRIVLWNPALMEFKTVPLPPPHFFPHYKVDEGFLGFGMDPLTNDYKVVLIRSFEDILDDHSMVPGKLGSVYTLITDSWKDLDLEKINLCYGSFYENGCSLFLSGIYYWLGRVRVDNVTTVSVDSWWKKVVFALDMGKETFRVIPNPDLSQFAPEDVSCSTLAIYEDRIAQLFYNNFVDIWLLSEEDIWIKKNSVGPFPVFFYPVGFWKNEGLFLVINEDDLNYAAGKMVLYDFSSQEIRNIGPRSTLSGFQTSVFYESLVSVQGGNFGEVNLDLGKQALEFLDNN